MRVGAVDLGTNSTRLLVADVDDGRVEEVARLSHITRRVARHAAAGRVEEAPRLSHITRLGEGVDERRKLLPLPVARVRNVLSDFRRELERLGAEGRAAGGRGGAPAAENG